MKKLLLILITVLALMFAYSVSADANITFDAQDTLGNNSYKASSTINPSAKIVGNASTWTCYLYGNMNGSNGKGTYRQIETDSGVTNNTFFNFTVSGLADARNYSQAIKCNASSNTQGIWTSGAVGTAQEYSSFMNFTIDTTAPSVVAAYPDTSLVGYQNKWISAEVGNTSVRFGVTSTDDNPGTCSLYLNFNPLTNSTSANLSRKVQSYSNATQFNFSNFNSSGAVGFPDNNVTGVANDGYKYYINCSDLAGNQGSVGGSFKVDVISPGSFNFNSSFFAWRTDNRYLGSGNYTATDYTPQVGIDKVSEPNFWYLAVNFFQGNYSNSSGLVQTNITSNTTRLVNISSLTGDRTFKIVLTAYDLAGNPTNMSNIGYSYSTTSTGRSLKAGWNIIGNTGNAVNLSDILSWSGATTASVFNTSHQFTSQVSGGSYGAVNIKGGEPVLLYLSADATFSDMIRNTSAYVVSHNLSNSSNSNWNLLMNRNFTKTDGFDLQRIDVYINGNSSAGVQTVTGNINLSAVSVYNNSASVGSKYIPFVGNWSINNQTRIKPGEVAWLYYNVEASGSSQQNITFDWGSVCRNVSVYAGLCGR